MKYDTIRTRDLSYAPCRYSLSRTLFRGPKRRLDEPYFAFIGGTETYGKFINKPFPTLVEKETGRTCVNFGCVNGGVDAFVNDPSIMGICNDADITVVQIMGANYLSNRFYSVHPRRNDRFLRASTVLQVIYQEVDFAEFTFTRHMLGGLYERSADRFEAVVAELRSAWVARMKNMLDQIGPRAILLWFSEEELSDRAWDERDHLLQSDPLFITASMIETLRSQVMDVVVVRPSDFAKNQGVKGMSFPAMELSVASEMLSVASHDEASAKLAPVLSKYMSVVA